MLLLLESLNSIVLSVVIIWSNEPVQPVPAEISPPAVIEPVEWIVPDADILPLPINISEPLTLISPFIIAVILSLTFPKVIVSLPALATISSAWTETPESAAPCISPVAVIAPVVFILSVMVVVPVPNEPVSA